jgi:hypothetical protein
MVTTSIDHRGSILEGLNFPNERENPREFSAI